MSFLKVKMRARILDARARDPILGPGVYDVNGNRVGQLVYQILDDYETQDVPYVEVEDGRVGEGRREQDGSVGKEKRISNPKS